MTPTVGTERCLSKARDLGTSPWQLVIERYTNFPRVRKPNRDGWLWPSTSVRCAAAVFPESEVDRTCRGCRENGARDPIRTSARKRCSSLAVSSRRYAFLSRRADRGPSQHSPKKIG